MGYQNQSEQTETVTIVSAKPKLFEDGGVKWMLRDDRGRVFQFYQTDRNDRDRETDQYREYQPYADRTRPYEVAIRFTEQAGVGASGDEYTLYKVVGFGAAE